MQYTTLFELSPRSETIDLQGHSGFNALLAFRIERREQNTDVTGVFHSSAGMTGDNKCSVHCDPS